MKKLLLILTGVGLTLAVLAGVGFVYAQDAGPGPEGWPPAAMGFGPHRDEESPAGEGILHDLMSAALAEEFGLTIEELEALHDEGTSLAEYAQELGLTVEEFQAKMTAARESALQEAVDQGLITQEQADFMLERGPRGRRGRRGPCGEGVFDPEDGFQGPGGKGGRGN
jgi:hypothetical protein